MKGVILAGGLGTRLSPLTRVTNKHLLAVYNKPMIYYPIECLVNAGVHDIMIVTGGNHAGDFLRLLGNGKDFGLEDLHYTYQEGEGGIADALRLAEHFADGDKIIVILGDNIIEKNICRAAGDFFTQRQGAKILLKQVEDPQRFGVAELDGKTVIGIEEKPKQPKSNLAVIGIYMYDNQIFDIIKTLKPSDRGELEITDVNNAYIAQGTMTCEVLDGWWTDAGTFESLYRATTLIAQGGANHPDGQPARKPATGEPANETQTADGARA
jgi:glucose-1-phosphate thymidylyltransferase